MSDGLSSYLNTLAVEARYPIILMSDPTPVPHVDLTHMSHHASKRSGSQALTLTCTYETSLSSRSIGAHYQRSGGRREIGGDLDQNEPPLQWMTSEATAVGLKTVSVRAKKRQDTNLQSHAHDVQLELKTPDPALLTEETNVIIHESLTCPWWLLEIMPWRRLSYKASKKETIM